MIHFLLRFVLRAFTRRENLLDEKEQVAGSVWHFYGIRDIGDANDEQAVKADKEFEDALKRTNARYDRALKILAEKL